MAGEVGKAAVMVKGARHHTVVAANHLVASDSPLW